MYSTKTPKTPSGKAAKGSVQVTNSHGRLQLRFRHGGKRRYISIGLPDTPTNRIVAEQRAMQIQLDIISGNFDETLAKYKPELTKRAKPEPAKPVPPPLRSLWEKYCEVKRPIIAPGTWRNGYQVNTSHLERCPYGSLAEAQKIFDWAVGNLNPDPARRFIQALGACCKWAVRSHLIDHNPFAGMTSDIKVLKQAAEDNDIDPFTRSERQAIIDAFSDSRYYQYYTPLVKFLFYTGCRPSEAAGFQWQQVAADDIVFNQAVVDSVYGRILKSGLKTQQKRKFPINQQLRQLLDEIRPERPKSGDLVFPPPRGKYLDFNNFRNRGWKAILKLLGIRYRKPYQTRHTFITHCLEEGISVSQVAKWVGNTPEVIMKHYAGTLAQFEVPIL